MQSTLRQPSRRLLLAGRWAPRPPPSAASSPSPGSRARPSSCAPARSRRASSSRPRSSGSRRSTRSSTPFASSSPSARCSRPTRPAAARGGGDDRPLLGVPIAVKDDTPVARRRRACAAPTPTATPEPEDCRARAAACAPPARSSSASRARPSSTLWPFTETAHGRHHAQPVGPAAHARAARAAARRRRSPRRSSPAATASDGAGSIRIPAACCGLFGLKVQRGRVPTAPLRGGLRRAVGLRLPHALASPTAALLYEVVDRQAVRRRRAARARRELRIALSTKIPPGSSARLHPDWRARGARTTAELLRSLGHEVVEREPSDRARSACNVIARYLAGVDAEAQAMAHPERLERRTRAAGAARRGARRLPRRAVARAGERRRARASTRSSTTSTSCSARRSPRAAAADRQATRAAARAYTLNGAAALRAVQRLWNHVGNPAAAVPAGFDADGLPLSVQLVGAPGRRGDAASRSRTSSRSPGPGPTPRPPVS